MIEIENKHEGKSFSVRIKAEISHFIPFLKFKPYVSSIGNTVKIIHIRKGVKIFIYKNTDYDHIEIRGNGFKCYSHAEHLRIDNRGVDMCEVTNGNWGVLFHSDLIPLIEKETGITQY